MRGRLRSRRSRLHESCLFGPRRPMTTLSSSNVGGSGSEVNTVRWSSCSIQSEYLSLILKSLHILFFPRYTSLTIASLHRHIFRRRGHKKILGSWLQRPGTDLVDAFEPSLLMSCPRTSSG